MMMVDCETDYEMVDYETNNEMVDCETDFISQLTILPYIIINISLTNYHLSSHINNKYLSHNQPFHLSL